MSSSSHDIKLDLSSLTDGQSVAALLDVSWPRLRHHLYRHSESKRYTSFTIPKKNGSLREISSPNHGLRDIQRRLLQCLETIYNPRSPVHGFTKERGILTNASLHCRSKYVFNVDLLDFFPTINFGRVRGLFIAEPYKCSPSVATVLAQICCHEGALPQGAPTSPIISNMICSRLDRQLQALASHHRCTYTRYADDITFSTFLSSFPQEIGAVEVVQGKFEAKPGSRLSEVVASNGFEINLEKVRIQARTERQEVTGLTTNLFPNVPRQMVRQIRAMLHAWRKHGLESAQTEYREKYWRGRRHPNRTQLDFQRVVKGKIDYVGMIKGRGNEIYLSLIEQLRALAPEMVTAAEINDPVSQVMDNLIVLETYEGDYISQGTSFLLKGYGFVTCSHVLGSKPDFTRALTRNDQSTRYKIRIKARNPDIDLAVLEIDLPHGEGLDLSDSKVTVGDSVQLAGFPNHNYGDSGILSPGAVIGWRRTGPFDRFIISQNIIFGNSGGPVLDANDKVVGVAVTGSANQDESRKNEANGVIPIDALRKLGPFASE